MKNKKLFVYLLLTGFILLASWLVLVLYSTFAYGHVEITTTPSDARVTISGEEYEPSTQIKLRAGTHTAKVTRKYFKAKEVAIPVRGGLKTKQHIELELEEELSENYYNLDEQTRSEIDGFYQEKNIVEEATLKSTNPIIYKLPYFGEGYRIEHYFTDESDPFKIGFEVIYSNKQRLPEIKSAALKWLSSAGIDTQNTTIEFVQLED